MLARIFKLMTVFVVLLSFLLAGCGISPEAARKELEKKNIPYDEKNLMDAVGRNNTEVVKLFLQAGMDPNVKVDGYTPLMQAAAKNRVEIGKLLVEKGSDINAKSKEGYTPLILAVAGESKEAPVNMEFVKFLLEKSADVNIQAEKDGGTALFLAISKGNSEAVGLLLAKNCNPNVYLAKDKLTPLMAAIKDGNLEIIKALLDKGADVNAKGGPKGGNLTALHLAIIKGDVAAARLILTQKNDVNSPMFDNGATPLMYAIANNNNEIVKELLSQGANVNAQEQDGLTALMLAVTGKNVEGVKALLDKGADVNLRTGNGGTALAAAKKLNIQEIIDLLIKAGAK